MLSKSNSRIARRACGDPARRVRPRRLQALEERILLTGSTAGQLVEAFYQDLLGRPADTQGLDYWSQQLAAGAAGTQVARGILASHEYHQNIVADDYSRLLGRRADAAGLSYWTPLLDQREATSSQLLAGLLGSNEYFVLHGSSNSQFIAALYHDVLGREAEPGATSFWLTTMSGGMSGTPHGASRIDVALAFVTSPEYEKDLVGGWYQVYLDRTAGAGELAFWTEQMAGGETPDDVLAEIVGSDEYRENVGKNAPAIAIASPSNGLVTNNDPTITGQVSGHGAAAAQLQAEIDSGPFSAVTLNAARGFSLPISLPLDGSADGAHTVHFKLDNQAGATTATADFSFTLVTTKPAITAFDLSPGSETGTPGDHTTSDARVTLVGQTNPGDQVSLSGLGLTALASSTGVFEFPNVSLALGDNNFVAQVSDSLGNTAQSTLTVHRVSPTGQVDPVIQWNENLLAAIRLDASDPQIASRAMAMVQSAVYDAVNAVEGKPGHFVTVAAPADASAPAAVSQAAHDVLAYLYPAQQAAFDSELAASLALVADGQPKTDGITTGAATAAAIIALRAGDGWKNYVDYTPGSGPGVWQPTAPAYAPALEPQWAQLTPWTMTSDSEFRPAGPPALSSAAWAQAVNETQSLGEANSTTRTADQTQVAHFWSDGGGTATPPGHWNEIAEQVATSAGNSLDENARLFAELDVGLADAAIVAWDAKYAYNAWRPITAIQNADTAGNPAVTQDTNWTPLLITPNFPEYVSGHSTFSGTAAGILDAVFGASTSFTIGSDALPGVTRSFTGFDQAAQEAGISRIYAGIHFLFSDTDGLAAGAALAQHVLATFNTSQDTVPPTITFTSPASRLATSTDPTVMGRVTDNLSGTKSLEVSVDGGKPVPVTFDTAGNFSVPTTFALDGTADGAHTLAFTATDFAGNTSPVTNFTFTLDTKPPIITLTAPGDGATLSSGAAATGTVDPTGSALVAFSYTIDGGTTMPITYDTAAMAMNMADAMPGMATAPPIDFNQALDLSKLAAGIHTLVVTAQDAAGNTTQKSVSFTLPAAIPLTITSFTPQNGVGDVGVTYRPQVNFSRPVDTSTLTAADFFATDTTGAVIPATIVPSNDGTFAWLFFTNDLPGASMITITVDGSQIKAADGSLLDAASSGTPGSKLTWSFTTVNTAPVPGTSLKGIVADPGPDLIPGTIDDVAAGPDHVLMTADDVYKLPIAGVKVYILGHEDQAVYTAADGSFTLSPIPTGDVKLALDGTTATNPPAGYYFANMVMDLHIQPGVTNTVMAAMADSDAKAQANPELGVYLPRLRTSLLETVNAGQGATITVGATSAPELTPEQQQNLKIDVAPNSLIGADGKPLASAQIGISTVPPQMVADMLPAGLLQHTFDITVQALGVAAFSAPATLTFPNVFNSLPGTKLDFLSFDHTTGRLVIDGTATVSADGKSVTTDPGVGVIHPGWHGLTPAGSSGGGGGGAPRGPRPPNNNPDEKCHELGNLAAVTAVEAVATDLLSLVEVTPLVGCGISLGAAAVGAVAEYAVAPSQFTAASLGYDLLGGAIGCVPFGIGSVAGIVYANDFQLTNALKSYHDCLYPSSPSPATPMAMMAGAATAAPFDNPFSDQARVLAESANLYSLFLGSSDWTMATPAELPKLNAFLAELQRDLAPGSDGGATITPAEAARLAALPLPASVTAADEQALVARMGHFFKGEFAAIGFDPQALSNAAQTLEQDLSALEAQGWQNDFDGLKLGLEELSQLIDSAARGNTGTMGVGTAAVQPAASVMAQTSTAPVLATSPLGLYWRLTDLSNGFETRGKFAPTQSSFDSVFLAPDTPYCVEYVDPTTLDYAATVFISAASGSPTQIPLAVFSAPPDATDTDGDGIPNIDEAVIGTDPTKYSTAGDGISDLAKIQQGLDPLANQPFATGVIASLPLSGEAQQVVLAGSTVNAQQQTAYIATGSYGLAIVDASQFDKPEILGQLSLPGDATSVSVDNNLHVAAVADGAGGLVLVDVSNPQSPQVTFTIPVDATQVIAVDGIAYAAVGGTLASYDMLTGESRQLVSLASGNITGLALDGTLLYAMDDANTLHVVDISQPLMAARGSLVLPQGGGQLFVGGGVAYVAAASDIDGGYETVDVSNPDSLKLIAASSATATSAVPAPTVVANGSGIALVTNQLRGAGLPPAIQVDNASDPTNTGSFLTSFPLPANPFGVAIGAGIGFVADGTAGLQVVNYLPFDTKGVAPKLSVDFNALDTDPNTPGIQVVEGSHVRLNVTVSDDVQVRNVELLVNGQIVANEVSFSFDLSTFLPTIAAAGNTVGIEVRAIDTGGNMATTGLVTLNLVRDTTPPTIVQTNPAAGDSRGQQFRTVIIDFSKPINPATVTASAIALTGPGISLTPENVQFRLSDSEVQLTYPAGTLPVGAYQLVIHAASITDMAGNALGTADVTISFTIAGNVDTWINLNGGDWSVPTNWDSGHVPQTGDDVIINVPGAPTITYSDASGATVINSLLSKDPFTISGGTLTATKSIEVDSTFTLTGDGTIKNTLILPGASGQGLTITSGFARLDGVTSNADLLLNGQTAGAQVTIVDGLTLNGTAHLNQGSFSDSINFVGSQTLGGTGTFLLGAGTASSVDALIDVSGAQSGTTATLTIAKSFTIHGERGRLVPENGSSIINQGTIAADVADPFSLGIQTFAGFSNQGTTEATNGGTLQFSGAWSNAAGGSITADASTLDLGSGSDAWNNAGSISAGNGSTVNLGGLVTLAGVGNFARSGGTVNLTGTLDDTNATLAMNASTGSWNVRNGTIKGGTYTSADGAGLVFSGGSGTLDGVTLDSDVDFSNATVTVLDGLTLNATAQLANATAGGYLVFSGAQTFAGNGSVVFGASGFGQIDATNGTVTIANGITIHGQAGQVLGAFDNQGTIAADTAGTTITVNSNGGAATITNEGVMQATNGAELDLDGSWTNAATGSITANASTLGLGSSGSAWTNAGTISSTNSSTVNLGGLLTVAALGSFQRSGGAVNLVGTLDITGSTLALNATTGSWNIAGGTVKGGTYTSADGAVLVVPGSSQGTLDGVTLDGDVQVAGPGADVVIKDGVTLNGTMTLGDTNGHGGVLTYSGVQTLGGTGSIDFVGNSGNSLNGISGTLTIGAGITLHGQSGLIFSSIINQGTIAADVAGGAIDIETTSFTNQGTLSATGGGTLNMMNGLVLPMTGTITAGAGGTVAVSGALTLAGASTVNVELAGTTTDKFGQLTVSGAATLDGTLNVSLANGYQPAKGDSFKIISFASATGQFATINGTSIPNNLKLAAVYDTGDVTLVAGQALQAAANLPLAAGAGQSSTAELTAADAASLVPAAVDLWAAAGLDPQWQTWLRTIQVSVAHLGGNVLGLAAGNKILVSDDADGYGWFVDLAPASGADFLATPSDHVLSAIAGSAAAGKFDLLTVLAHELGHELGLVDMLDAGAMNELLAPGQRRLPTAEEVDAVFQALG